MTRSVGDDRADEPGIGIVDPRGHNADGTEKAILATARQSNMTDLLAARSQMAMSLGFHIVFAAIGIAMPLMMTIAEWRWIRTGQPSYLTLAKRWSKGAAILFAVGAVSGTVLSFELGLLWPHFMEWAGPIIGPLFALEGFAFFTEAIFLGIYLYGWSHLPPKLHVAAGAIVALSGVASAIAVVAANAWMNTPSGFQLLDGLPRNIQPWAVMTNPHTWDECVHMVLAAFAATGFLVAGIHAFMLLRYGPSLFHEQALGIALLVGGIPALLQPLSGDLLTKAVAKHQPAKLAAMEALFHTEQGAPFHLGGVPDVKTGTVPYSLEVPKALSLLLYMDPRCDRDRSRSDSSSRLAAGCRGPYRIPSDGRSGVRTRSSHLVGLVALVEAPATSQPYLVVAKPGVGGAVRHARD